MAGKSIPTEQRFWPKVERGGPDECWIWRGNRNQKGYGRIAFGRRARPTAQVAWELTHGKPFPSGKFACHKCDNPGCVNPDHIWPGTHAENMRDMTAKGRKRRSGWSFQTIFIQFSDDGQSIRRWGRKPFDGALRARLTIPQSDTPGTEIE